MSGHVRIKVCGITTAHDARQAALLGCDAIGLNFYSGSPRHIAADTASAVIREIPVFVDVVGVFVNQPLEEVRTIVEPIGRFGAVQWHGDRHWSGDPYPFRYIAAFAIAERDSLRQVDEYLENCRGQGWSPAAVLLDAHMPGLHGGTGRTAPWNLLADYRPGVPVILAGGLTPDNVADAIRLVRPYAVDVASGVESRSGVKDAEKMRRFIENAREAALK